MPVVRTLDYNMFEADTSSPTLLEMRGWFVFFLFSCYIIMTSVFFGSASASFYTSGSAQSSTSVCGARTSLPLDSWSHMHGSAFARSEKRPWIGWSLLWNVKKEKVDQALSFLGVVICGKVREFAATDAGRADTSE